MIRLIKVTGDSLVPLVQEGDFVVIFKIPFFVRFRSGDMVVFRHPEHGTLIKRVEWVTHDGHELYVTGLHPESTDSRQFGLVPRDTVVGKVIWHIRKQA